MASPVSFGDAVAMYKIAWGIACAFTKGRKSAPAEFREVENQLYSLSAALAAFKDVCGGDLADVAIDTSKLPARFQTDAQDGAQTVSRIMDSCGETLKHLEQIVEQYGIVAELKDPTKSRLQRWSADLAKNYKKIAWTTEAGDLAALRSNLMVHTNSLDLVLGIIVSSRTSRIEDSLKANSNMLKEIHSWWVQNLRDAAAAPSTPARGDQHLGQQAVTKPMLLEVSLVTDGVSQMLCPQACLYDDWQDTASPELFMCRCAETKAVGQSPTHSRVENISLSSLCFPFRRPGHAGSWMLAKALDKATNQMVLIHIKIASATDLVEFEDSFVRPLVEAWVSATHEGSIGNQLVHLSPDAQHVRMLNLQSDMTHLYQLVDSITFHVAHRSLSKPNVTGLSLRNYRERGHANTRSTDLVLSQAELTVYYASQETEGVADITKSIVHLTHATTLSFEQSNSSVVLTGVECLGLFHDQQRYRLEKADVAIRMRSLEAAKMLHEKLVEMKRELFVAALQHPRPDETVALHLQATEVQCDVAIIADAELTITRSRQGKYRLIVASRNRCTVLSQDLPDAFFTSPSPHTAASSFAAPTWVVQLEGDGKQKLYHYPNGFSFLSFCGTNAERMFELGRTALLQGATAQSLPLR